jgi:hypothetical protein
MRPGVLVEEQQERFLRAIYETQNEAGRSHVLDIAQHLGLDIIDNKGDRDLYREITLQLRDNEYIDCTASDYRVACGIVELTPRGLRYFEL